MNACPTLQFLSTPLVKGLAEVEKITAIMLIPDVPRSRANKSSPCNMIVYYQVEPDQAFPDDTKNDTHRNDVGVT